MRETRLLWRFTGTALPRAAENAAACQEGILQGLLQGGAPLFPRLLHLPLHLPLHRALLDLELNRYSAHVVGRDRDGGLSFCVLPIENGASRFVLVQSSAR
jgi:hypothetical protein